LHRRGSLREVGGGEETQIGKKEGVKERQRTILWRDEI